jgi:hypothetical protein
MPQNLPKKFNHMFDIAFTLENANPNGEATAEELLAALEKRIAYFKNPQHHSELLESCGYCDSFEVAQSIAA